MIGVSSESCVLLVSIVDITASNGGALWTRNLLSMLSEMNEHRVNVVLLGPERVRSQSIRFVESLGLAITFLTIPEQATRTALSRVRDIALSKYRFLHESDAARSHVVCDQLDREIELRRPQIILFNYLYSALFAPRAIRSGRAYCVVTLNREAEFQRNLRATPRPGRESMRRIIGWIGRNFNVLSNARLARFESQTYRNSVGVVALTQSDLPEDIPSATPRATFPPILAPRAEQWLFRKTRRLFFVGNIRHYPNFEAIRWLCLDLAPALARRDSGVRIAIIGASADDVPSQWHADNVKLLGFSDHATVVREFMSADIFVAPVLNAFGAKLKLTECIAHGTPFIGTNGAMSGLPFLDRIPTFDVAAPEQAADQIVDILNDSERLRAMSREATSRAATARKQQVAEWDEFFARAIAYGERRPAPR